MTSACLLRGPTAPAIENIYICCLLPASPSFHLCVRGNFWSIG